MPTGHIKRCFMALSNGAINALGSRGAVTRFETTRWSIVTGARAGNDRAREALESLCRIYRPPVLEYIRRRGYTPETAEDLAQSFFAQFLQHSRYERADPARGRFRAFLLASLKRFLIDAGLEARRVKRGGRVHFKSLDTDPAYDSTRQGIADTETPERAFERCWAHALLDSAMNRLRQEAIDSGKQELFDSLGEFLTERPDEADYARVAAALKMRRNTLAVAVHRMRQRLRELVRDELAQTTLDAGGLECEMHEMNAELGRTID